MKYLSPIFKTSNANPDHTAVLGALDNALTDACTSTDDLRNELVISTATGSWLDQWGDWFGVRRLIGESDSAFRSRILGTLTQDKLTIPALINLIKNALGQDTVVTVTEPYTQTFLLGSSKLSEARLMDGTYYRVGVVSFTVNKPITDSLTALLNTAKAAGTKIVVTYQP